MTKGYRIANDVPWDNPEKPPDWGKAFTRPNDVIAELMKRARKNVGGGFKLRERGEAQWSQTRTIKQLDNHAKARITDDSFHIGDVLMVLAVKSDVRWLIREVDLPTVSMETVGDDDIDFNHTLIFKDQQFNEVESWGIRNDRYISGSSTPSYHWARRDSREGGQCTARAEDFGGAPLSKLWDVGRKLGKEGHVGKMLLAGHEWLPGWGEFRFVGSFIGHYDHLHAESRHGDGALC